MEISPEKEPRTTLKRFIVAGLIGATILFSAVWSILAIAASVALGRGLEGDAGFVLTWILTVGFLIAGCYSLFRFVPSMFTYLARELNGHYALSSTSESLFITPQHGGKKLFEWKDIAEIRLHENLVACSALSILLKSGADWTFGNIYSPETLEHLRKTILKWQGQHQPTCEQDGAGNQYRALR